MTRLILQAILFISIVFYAGCKKQKITFAAGFSGGTYYKIGESLRGLPELDVTDLLTDGSIDNINHLLDKKANFGITQLDVLQNYSIGAPEVKGQVRVVIPMYGEEVHVVAHKGIKSIQDLKGKRISIGEANSGMKITSLIFLSQSDITEDTTKIEEFHPTKAIPMLLNKELDAVILIGGYPLKILSDIPAAEKANIHIVNFDGTVYEAVRGANILYQRSTIPEATYPWQEGAIKTIVVESVLIARSDVSDSEVSNLVKNIFENRISLGVKHEKWNKINIDTINNIYTKNPDLFHPAMKEIIPELSKYK